MYDAPLGYVSTTIVGCPVPTWSSYAKASAPFWAQNRLENTSAIRSPSETSQPTRLCETVKTQWVMAACMKEGPGADASIPFDRTPLEV
jgi:hypothetical protein